MRGSSRKAQKEVANIEWDLMQKKVGHSHKPRNTPNVWFVEGLEDLPKPLQKAEEGTTATIRFCIAEIVEIVGR